MANHLTGPHLNTDLNRGNREWYSGMPRGFDPDFVVWHRDWLETEELDQTNDFAVVSDTNCAAAVVANALNGEITLSSEASTDDVGNTVQTAEEFVALTSGKKLWLEARLKSSDADDQDIFFGLCDTIATNPEAVVTDADRMGFFVTDGNASINCTTESGGTATETDSGEDLADNTYVKLGMRYDGVSSVEFYVDRAKVATHTANLPDDQNLAVTLFQLSGSDSGTKVMTCDYVTVIHER